MRIQAGPLITIIGGFVIVAIGVFWHLHTGRTEKTASRGVTPSGLSQSSDLQPSPKKEETSGENIVAGDIVVKSAIVSNTLSNQHQDVERSSNPVAETSTTTDVHMSDAEFKSSALAFASKIRAFEQSFDSRRDQIFDKRVGHQADRYDQFQELKTIETKKASEFTQAFLPQAQFIEGDLLRRLQGHGINVPMPPPPRGISIALGRSLLHLDTRDIVLPGHRPVHGLASYLELLASNLPD
jgi:hypothetical protein